MPVTLDALMHEPSFRDGCAVFYAKDENLGSLLCHASLGNDNKLYGHFVSAAGRMGLAGFDVSAWSRYYRHLDFDGGRRPTSLQEAVAVACMYYWINPDMLPGQSYAELDRSEATAARMANALEVARCDTAHSLQALQAILQPQQGKFVTVDVISTSTGSGPLHDLLPQESIRMSPRDDSAGFPSAGIDFGMRDNLDKRENLLSELIHTERSYISRLQHLIEDYSGPLRVLNRRKPVIGNYELNQLFPSALETIVTLNTNLLRDLESATSTVETAHALVENIGLMKKSYARYLEDSAARDTILREAAPKLHEFLDETRQQHRQAVGVRELVMEPVGRIPRYSLLITSILKTMEPHNPAAEAFVRALNAVRDIGRMDDARDSRIIRLATLCADWPPQLVSASMQLLDIVDAEMVDLDSIDAEATKPCSLILLSDRLVVVKRKTASTLDSSIKAERKDVLSFDSMQMLERTSVHEEELITIIGDGVRPLARYSLGAVKSRGFCAALRTAQTALRMCTTVSTGHCDAHELALQTYDAHDWEREAAQLKGTFRVWEDVDDGNVDAFNFVISSSEQGYSLRYRHGSRTNELLRGAASIDVVRTKLFETVVRIYRHSWLNPDFIDVAPVWSYVAMTLAQSAVQQAAPARVRPSSPVKVMSSFISGLKERSKPAARPASPGIAKSAADMLRPRSPAAFRLRKHSPQSPAHAPAQMQVTPAPTLPTPDLIDDYSGTDDASATRSIHSLEQQPLDSFQRDNMLGIHGLDEHDTRKDVSRGAGRRMKNVGKDLPPAPAEDYDTSVDDRPRRRQIPTDQNDIDDRPKPKVVARRQVLLETGSASPRSPAATPQEVYREFAGFFSGANQAASQNTPITAGQRISPARRSVGKSDSPSRLPVRSPAHSRDPSAASPTAKDDLSPTRSIGRGHTPSGTETGRRRVSGIPRLPSMLVSRKASLGLSRAFSGAFGEDLDLTLRFLSGGDEADIDEAEDAGEKLPVLPKPGSSQTAAAEGPVLTPSRSTIRREIGAADGSARRSFGSRVSATHLNVVAASPTTPEAATGADGKHLANDIFGSARSDFGHQRTGSRGDALRRLSKQLATARVVEEALGQPVVSAEVLPIVKTGEDTVVVAVVASSKSADTSTSAEGIVGPVDLEEDDELQLEPIDRPRSPGKMAWPEPVHTDDAVSSARPASPPSSIAPSHMSLHPKALAAAAAAAAAGTASDREGRPDLDRCHSANSTSTANTAAGPASVSGSEMSFSAYSTRTSLLGGPAASASDGLGPAGSVSTTVRSGHERYDSTVDNSAAAAMDVCTSKGCAHKVRQLEDEIRFLKLRVRHLQEQRGNPSAAAQHGLGHGRGQGQASAVGGVLSGKPLERRCAPRTAGGARAPGGRVASTPAMPLLARRGSPRK